MATIRLIELAIASGRLSVATITRMYMAALRNFDAPVNLLYETGYDMITASMKRAPLNFMVTELVVCHFFIAPTTKCVLDLASVFWPEAQVGYFLGASVDEPPAIMLLDCGPTAVHVARLLVFKGACHYTTLREILASVVGDNTSDMIVTDAYDFVRKYTRMYCGLAL